MKSSDIQWYIQIFHDIFRYYMKYEKISRYQGYQKISRISKDIKDIKDIKRYEKMGEELCCSCSCMHSIILYCTIQYNKIQYNTIQCITIVLYCILLHCIALYCIVFHWPTPLEDIKRYQKIMLLQQLLQQRPPLNYSPLNRGLKSTGHNFEKKIKSPRVHHRIGIWKMHTRGF